MIDSNPIIPNTQEALKRSLHRNLYIKTYGCQMNVYDSEIIVKLVKNLGFNVVDNATEADLVILNTCHIREKAAEKIYSELGQIRVLQEKTNKKIITVVAGCVAQAEGTEIFKRANNVDIIVGPQSLHSLPELITKVERNAGHEIKLDFEPIKKFDFLKEEFNAEPQAVLNNRVGLSYNVSAFLSIQEGCDKFCTFCVVPYTRGAEFSRRVEDILAEAQNMVEKGVKEITLLGQNVNGYHGKDLYAKSNNKQISLGKLINYLAQIKGLERIRYTTSHPMDMHEALYVAHANEPKLMPHMHLPVQSGSDQILKKMNRKYTTAQYLEIIKKLKTLRPDIAFSSDFIVGFSTETDEDFQKTLELVENVCYAQSYSFKYSPRPGTPGAEYKQIDEKIKAIRLQKLQQLLQKQQLEFNQQSVGKILPVLFDRKVETKTTEKNMGKTMGRTPYMQSIYSEREDIFGQIRNVLITEGLQNSLKGKILE